MNIPIIVSPGAKPAPVVSPAHRIPSLDGLRAISILLVLVGHSELTYSHHSRWANFLLLIFGNAGLGVLIFFVISGFLITTLLLNEYEKKGSINLFDFYVRRAFRIFPAFYCYLAVILCLWMMGFIHLTWPVFVTAALFLRDYAAPFIHSHPSGDWFVGHTWTLSVEEQFYWLWPLCLIFARPRRAAMIAVLLVALDPVIRTAEYFLLPATREEIPIMLHTRVDSLMIGCLIALFYRNMKFQSVLKLLYRKQVPLLAAVFLFVVSPLLDARLHGIYNLPIGWTLENIGAGLVLLWAIDNAGSKIGSLLNSRLLVHVGIISYSLYLWQQLFLTNLNPLSCNKFPLNIIFAFLAAELSYCALERPILFWRRRLNTTRFTQKPTLEKEHSTL